MTIRRLAAVDRHTPSSGHGLRRGLEDRPGRSAFGSTIAVRAQGPRRSVRPCRASVRLGRLPPSRCTNDRRRLERQRPVGSGPGRGDRLVRHERRWCEESSVAAWRDQSKQRLPEDHRECDGGSAVGHVPSVHPCFTGRSGRRSQTAENARTWDRPRTFIPIPCVGGTRRHRRNAAGTDGTPREARNAAAGVAPGVDNPHHPRHPRHRHP